jgi:hypothetical protein
MLEKSCPVTVDLSGMSSVSGAARVATVDVPVVTLKR